MRDFNFDKIKNIEIPDTWVNGAVNVPKKPATTFIVFKKVLPMVASFILVFTLSFVVYHMLKDDSKVVPKPIEESSYSENVTVNSETEKESLAETKNKKSKKETKKNNRRETVGSTEHSVIIEQIVVNPTDKKEEETKKPEVNGNTQKPEAKPDIKPAPEPTEKPTQSPETQKPSPSEKPSVKPETNPTQSPPNENDGSSSGESDSSDSSNPDSSPGSSDSFQDTNYIRCYATISLSEYLNDARIFCFLNTGPGDLSAEEEMDMYNVSVEVSNGIVYLEYVVNNENKSIRPGTYSYFFGNDKGHIFYFGEVTVK
ncbi:MAG: hypothetical protein IKB73_06320 [Ruminococcus sp.]|nr:hypothetical protein [Ruminococcus sp.]